MKDLLLILQAIVSVSLIICILFQQRGTALGSAFGGGGGDFYGARRGAQKFLFRVSIVLGISFVALALLNLFL